MFILSIDSNSSHLQAVNRALYKIDPEGVHLTSSEPELALAIIRDNKPDAIIMETVLDNCSGIELAHRIRDLSADCNIIFATEHPGNALDAFGVHASGYILHPVDAETLWNEINNLRRPIKKEESGKLKAQCFGNFEVFYNGRIMHFSRSLSKEALAYLIDRRGAGCTVSEICSVLWEDRQTDAGLKSQCRVIMGALKKDLEAVGAGDVLVKMWNTWSVNTDLISCDYYDYLDNENAPDRDFQGEYMVQYSWAEITSGSLASEI